MVRCLLAAASLVALAGCMKPWVSSTRDDAATLVPEPTARRRISFVPGSAVGFQNPCSDPAPIPVDPAVHGKEGGNSQKEE